MNPSACGIEVSAKTLEICLAQPGETGNHLKFPNTQAGHRRLTARLRREDQPVQVVMEATGVYGLDLALTLAKTAGIDVMVANPRAARRFAQALMQRAKTDRVDARMLCQFAQSMPFEAWQPPAHQALTLRAITRRIQALVEQRTAEKGRLHAAQASRFTPSSVSRSLKRQIRTLDREIDRLMSQAQTHIDKHEDLKQRHRLLLTIPGVGPKSSIHLLGELSALPDDMEPRQWVAHAGLDPRPVESGSSVHKPRRISGTGNPRLRRALFMPAMVAMRHSPQCRCFYQQLLDRGLKPMQAIVALMRKLLHAIHGIWTHRRAFDGDLLFPNLVRKAA